MRQLHTAMKYNGGSSGEKQEVITELATRCFKRACTSSLRQPKASYVASGSLRPHTPEVFTELATRCLLTSTKVLARCLLTSTKVLASQYKSTCLLEQKYLLTSTIGLAY